MTIEDALYKKLCQSDAVTALVGQRIHNTHLPPNPTIPAIVFSYDSGQRTGKNTWAYEMEIEIWGTTPPNARTIADVVSSREVLENWKCEDPETGPWRLQEERNDARNPDNGESFAGGKLIQTYLVSFDR